MQYLTWVPNHQYNVGDAVTYQGRVYRVIQAHWSQLDWAPDVVPALFRAGEYLSQESDFGFRVPPPAYPEPSRGMSFPTSPIDQPLAPSMPGIPNFPQGPHTPQFPLGPGAPEFPRSATQFPDFGPGFPQMSPDHPRSPPIPTPVSAGGRYTSSEEWIQDAKHRAGEFRMHGPKGPTTWLLCQIGQIPEYAILAGQEPDGEPIYIARNFHEGGLHIGWASRRGASLSWGGGEIPLTTYEVLIGDSNAVEWAPTTKRQARPVEGGYEADGKALWIAQARYGNRILPGKTAGWDSGAYIAHEGFETAVPEYNVLVYRN